MNIKRKMLIHYCPLLDTGQLTLSEGNKQSLIHHQTTAEYIYSQSGLVFMFKSDFPFDRHVWLHILIDLKYIDFELSCSLFTVYTMLICNVLLILHWVWHGGVSHTRWAAVYQFNGRICSIPRHLTKCLGLKIFTFLMQFKRNFKGRILQCC